MRMEKSRTIRSDFYLELVFADPADTGDATGETEPITETRQDVLADFPTNIQKELPENEKET